MPETKIDIRLDEEGAIDVEINGCRDHSCQAFTDRLTELMNGVVTNRTDRSWEQNVVVLNHVGQ